MKGFFESKPKNFNKDINKVLDYLIQVFKPVQSERHSIQQNRGKHKPKEKVYFWTAEVRKFNDLGEFDPIENIQITHKKGFITIYGTGFEYKFPPEQLLRVKQYMKHCK